MTKQMPSPVSFAKVTKGGPSPVMMSHAEHTQDSPPSHAEAIAAVAAHENGPSTRPVLHVEDSFLTSGEAEFILKPGHRTVSGEVELRNEDSGNSVIVTAVECWNLVAQDLSPEQIVALGWLSKESMCEDMDWNDDDWGVTPVTVIQVARA